jgi:hypothetical protein
MPGSQGCAYELTIGRAYPRPAVGMLLAGGLATHGGLWLVRQADDSGHLALAGWAAALAGLFLMATWYWWQFSERSILHNPATGQRWEQVELFGRPVSRRVTGAVQPVVWQGAPARGLKFPASVVEFYREGSTTDILAAALLQLAAQGWVVFGLQWEKNYWGSARSRFIVQAGRGVAGAVVDGRLEQRLMAVISDGPAYGIPLTGLTTAVLGQKNQFPRRVVVDGFVGPEAEALGLGQVQVVGLRQALNPADNARARIGRDLDSIRLLYGDLWTHSPEFAREMLVELDRAVLQTAGPGQGESNIPAASKRQ